MLAIVNTMAGLRAGDASSREQLAEEQAALRRVATLVAQGAPAETLFTVVAEQVAAVLNVPLVSIVSFEPDGTATERASVSPRGTMFRVGTRWSLEGTSVVGTVRESGRPSRIDDYSGLTGPIAEACRRVGIRSRVGIPIVVAGRLWGAMVVSSLEPDPLAPDTEARLTDFTELVATAIANSEASDSAARLTEEQAALRRVATLVAQGAPAETLFTVVAEQVAAVLSVPIVSIVGYELDGTATQRASVSPEGTVFSVGTRWSLEGTNVVGLIRESVRPARIDDYGGLTGSLAESCRRVGIRSTVGTPIVVAGRLWGAMLVSSFEPDPPAPDTEVRLTNFTELVASAIANSEASDAATRLTEEQVALRRVATLVAEGVPPSELFGAVVEEVGRLLGADLAGMIRYETDATVTAAATWAAVGEHPPVEGRWSLEGDRLASAISATGRPAREDDWAGVRGPIAEFVRTTLGVASSVGSPIVVEGHVWGALFVHSKEEARPLPSDTEARLTNFTELVATAMSNVEARREAHRLAEEQAALRRVATLVAQEASPAEVFEKVAEELGSVLGGADCTLWRAEGDGTASAVALWGSAIRATFRLGERLPIDGQSLTATAIREGRPCRLDDVSEATGTMAERGRALGIRSAVSCPVVVRGRSWGALSAGRYTAEPFPPETETRLARFAELIATAVGNADARAEIERLADEQAALRRVATMVAHESPPAEVFAAVAEEVAQVLGVQDTTIFRFEDNSTATVVADRGEREISMPVGSRVSLEGESATALVRRTGRAARVDDFADAAGPLAEYTRDAGIGSTVGSPIVVDGRLWGAMIAATRTGEPMPADTESRIEKFTQLVATAISNMQARSDLAASRARLVTAGDDARRRVVRDLHDGAQQQLVHTIVTLKLACRSLRDGDGNADSLVAEALEQAERGNMELRELARGLLPPALTRGGLRAGLDAVVRRVDLPVRVDVPDARFQPETEASAYFIVAEALTNVMKHSNARGAEVRASVGDGSLRVEVRDDGIGGADPAGQGLLGMADRVTALGGGLRVESPVGGGTLVVATLPLRSGQRPSKM
jgi:GAF domain-containing protein